jgi:hypothetical protein
VKAEEIGDETEGDFKDNSIITHSLDSHFLNYMAHHWMMSPNVTVVK